MSDYLVHSSRERVRFRHPVFGAEANKTRAVELLKDLKGVMGVKPGVTSILVFLEPEAKLAEIRQELEKTFPELLIEIPDPVSRASTDMVCKPKKTPQQIEKRHRQLKTLLAAGITTVSLAAVGWHHLHAWAGGVFAILATHHVWERRARL